MKKTLFLLLILLAIKGFSQPAIKNVYIEIRGSIDILGNIYLHDLVQPKKISKTDSLVNYTALSKTILQLKDPVKVINTLAAEGWSLVSVTQVQSDREGRPSSPFMLYYFRHEFKTGND